MQVLCPTDSRSLFVWDDEYTACVNTLTTIEKYATLMLYN
jgi:hypothetical protein